MAKQKEPALPWFYFLLDKKAVFIFAALQDRALLFHINLYFFQKMPEGKEKV